MNRIGYLLPDFPSRSETFVASEVARLQRRGVRVEPIVLSRSRRAAPEMLARLREEGIEPYYLLDRFPLRVAIMTARFALAHPVRALATARANRRLPIVGGASRLSRLLKALACAALVRARSLRHLHGHWTLPTDVAMLASAATGVPYSFSAHAHDIYEDAEEYERERADAGLADRVRGAAFVLTCSHANLEHLRSKAPDDAKKIVLAYHGVDTRALDGTKAAEDGPPVVLSVGRLVAYKGFDRFIRACARVARSNEIECVIVGDGSQREALKELASREGLDGRITFTGAVAHSVVVDWMRRAAVFVLCGDVERGQWGLPNVLLEAMAMRTATVTTWLPTVGELIDDGRNGYVAADEDEVAAVVQRLVEDPAERARVADAARATVETRFDADRTIEVLVQLLRAGHA